MTVIKDTVGMFRVVGISNGFTKVNHQRIVGRFNFSVFIIVPKTLRNFTINAVIQAF